MIGVCVRPERDKREKTGIKSICLEDCFRLHWNQQHYTCYMAMLFLMALCFCFTNIHNFSQLPFYWQQKTAITVTNIRTVDTISGLTKWQEVCRIHLQGVVGQALQSMRENQRKLSNTLQLQCLSLAVHDGSYNQRKLSNTLQLQCFAHKPLLRM